MYQHSFVGMNHFGMLAFLEIIMKCMVCLHFPVPLRQPFICYGKKYPCLLGGGEGEGEGEGGGGGEGGGEGRGRGRGRLCHSNLVFTVIVFLFLISLTSVC